MLKDLNLLITESRREFDELAFSTDIRLDQKIASTLEPALSTVETSSTFEVYPFSIQLKTRDHLRADMPSSWLWYGAVYWRLSIALEEYKQYLKQIKTAMAKRGHNTAQIKQYLTLLPSPDWRTVGDVDVAKDFSEEIDLTFTNEEEKNLFIKLVSDRDWWIMSARDTEATAGKTLSRTDVFDSSLSLACQVVVTSSSKLNTVIKAFSNSPDLREAFSELTKTEESLTESRASFEGAAENVIFYGAPGVGKSHKIDGLCNDSNSTRVTFHPDTQYSDFVGCLRPMMEGDSVRYEFRAGAFIRALVAASNSQNMHFLIIEEINRASAAAAFGEIFQLLDRKPTGESVYSIDASDPDMVKYLASNAPNCLADGKLRIPANLSIFATMNSSDQAVMPMDTAFKRRWRFEYVPLDFRKSPSGKIKLSTGEDQDKLEIEWKEFAQIINDTLAAHRIPEDRLLGPWFLSQDELSTTEKAAKALGGKLLLYLWDDVLRHDQHDIIFNEIRNYGELIKALSSSKQIFNSTIFDEIKNRATSNVELVEGAPASAETDGVIDDKEV